MLKLRRDSRLPISDSSSDAAQAKEVWGLTASVWFPRREKMNRQSIVIQQLRVAAGLCIVKRDRRNEVRFTPRGSDAEIEGSLKIND